MITAIHKSLAAKREAILKNEDKGFTLIELLVVVLIIGVLAAIAIPVFLGVQSTAVDSAVKADLTNLKTATVAYQTSSGGALPAVGTTTLGEVTIDAQNYTGGVVPTLASATTGASGGFCWEVTGSNTNEWHVNDDSAPESGGC